MKTFVRVAALLSALMVLDGCAGLLVDSLAKSMVTGKTYEEMGTKLPHPTAGNGRLFIYRTATSTNYSIATGIGIVKDPTICTVDDTPYEVIWEVYRYIDLPEGMHELSCGSDIVKSNGFLQGISFQRGSNRIQISISNTFDAFVRVDSIQEKPFFKPTPIDAMQGRTEILKLPLQEKGQFLYPGTR